MADAIFIPDEARQEFWPSGATRIRSILDETWLRLLRDTVDEEIRNAGPGGHVAGPGRATFFASIRPWRWRDAFRHFVFEPPVALIAARLLGSPSVQLLSDQLFVKEPGAVERTPWRQHLPFWPLRGTRVRSVRLALGHVDLSSGGLPGRRRKYSTSRFGDDVVFDAPPGRVQLEECRAVADGDPLPPEAFPFVSPKELCRL